MKRIFYLIFCFSIVCIHYNNAQEFQDLVNVGDELIIGKSDNGTYHHIDIPRKNFIIKRGGIADMKSLYGKKATVQSLEEHKGDYFIVLRATNGKFFKVYRTLRADLNNALANGELIIPQKSKKNSLAK